MSENVKRKSLTVIKEILGLQHRFSYADHKLILNYAVNGVHSAIKSELNSVRRL